MTTDAPDINSSATTTNSTTNTTTNSTTRSKTGRGAPKASAPERTVPERSQWDERMRRLLRLPADAPKGTKADAQKAFQTSIMVASIRCLLMYIVLPFVLPVVGFAAGVGPWLGLTIAVLAIVAVTMSIRRFWRADHPKRWAYTALGSVVIVFMAYSIVIDLRTILG